MMLVIVFSRPYAVLKDPFRHSSFTFSHFSFKNSLSSSMVLLEISLLIISMFNFHKELCSCHTVFLEVFYLKDYLYFTLLDGLSITCISHSIFFCTWWLMRFRSLMPSFALLSIKYSLTILILLMVRVDVTPNISPSVTTLLSGVHYSCFLKHYSPSLCGSLVASLVLSAI